MARIKRAYTKTKAKPGRKVKFRRQSYTSELKSKATAWKLVYGMKQTAIQKKLKDEYGIEVAMSTLSSWILNRKKFYLLGGIQKHWQRYATFFQIEFMAKIKDLTLNRDQMFL